MATTPSSTPTEGHPTVDATRARQGRLGRPVLLVLLATLALVVIGFAITYAFHSDDFARTEPNNAKEAADAQAFNAPEPAAINPQPYQKGTAPETNHVAPDPGASAPAR